MKKKSNKNDINKLAKKKVDLNGKIGIYSH